MSEGVKGTREAGGEDKERSGTGAALTPERPVLEEMPPSAGRLWKVSDVAVAKDSSVTGTLGEL